MQRGTPTLRRWADLNAGLVARIADGCALEGYASCRAVCSTWRSTLPPPSSRPLAPIPADDTTSDQPVSFAACSHHAQRWSRLLGLRQPSKLSATTCRCVGARDGWIALVAGGAETGTSVLLFNPLTGTEIPLSASLYDPRGDWAPKVVFSPGPTPRHFAAVSICRPNLLAVQRSGHGNSSNLHVDTDEFMDGEVLADVAYCDDGTVYCLTRHGGVHVLHLNHRRRGWWPRPVEVKPLLTGTDVFPPPYDTISRFTDAKNLVLCDGVLYQIWRRPWGAGSVDAPAGGWQQQLLHISEGGVFVLRYDPGRRPCWTEAQDLGGNAVFVGTNDAVAVRGEGATGLRGNCVYYWASRSGEDYEAVVFDLATRRSQRWLLATGGVLSPLWYFLPAAGRGHVEATAMEATSMEASIPDTI